MNTKSLTKQQLMEEIKWRAEYIRAYYYDTPNNKTFFTDLNVVEIQEELNELRLDLIFRNSWNT